MAAAMSFNRHEELGHEEHVNANARKIAIDAMITAAKDMIHHQFIFITPQDLSSIKTDPMLKIFKMPEPDRSQLVGGLSQQTLDFSPAAI